MRDLRWLYLEKETKQVQYIYDEKAGETSLKVEGENHKYLFKVRRVKVGDIINFRNLVDNNLYSYKISLIDKKSATLTLESSEQKEVKPNKYLHLGWCVVDPKTIEKTLASLNELGVSKISFIYADFSQKNFKINFERLDKILINSSIQCGRSDKIEFELFNSLKEFLENYPESYMFNFSQNIVSDKKNDIETIVVGPEGGFTAKEIALFSEDKIVGIDSNIILRSESAVTCITSLLLF